MPYPEKYPAPKNPKILLVDDREDNLLSIEAILKTDGYQFFRAYSGHQALKILLEEVDFAMILMDVKMPVMNGFETATLIYERERLRHIPIIFITANSYGDENVFKGYKAGGIDYIFKPINPEILRLKVVLFIDIYRKNALLVEQEQRLKTLNESLDRELQEIRISGEKVKQTNTRLKNEISDLESCLVSNKLSQEDFVFEESDLHELMLNSVESINDLFVERKATVVIEPMPRLRVSPILIRPLVRHLMRIGLDSVKENLEPAIKIRSEIGLPGQPDSKSAGDDGYCSIIFEEHSLGGEREEMDSSTGNLVGLHLNGASKKISNSLIICRKIMEQHNGFVDVKNSDNGLTLTISFPVLTPRE